MAYRYGDRQQCGLFPQSIEDYVGKKVEHGIDPMECVALGAAVQGAVMTGEVKDVVVTNAQPQGVFDDAATRAIKRWKFKPTQIDGAPHEQLVALRLRFAIQK